MADEVSVEEVKHRLKRKLLAKMITGKTRRIHITGAAGAGVTTLGHGLADALAIPHHDTDDYYWRPTNPPYREARAVRDRLRLMKMFLDQPDWVLSGSFDSWGDPITPLFDLVVFLYTGTNVRLKRLRARETERFGAEAAAPGGWWHEEMENFIEWVSHYDDGSREGRTLARHHAWLATVPCPVLHLKGTRPLPDLIKEISAAIERGAASS